MVVRVFAVEKPGAESTAPAKGKAPAATEPKDEMLAEVYFHLAPVIQNNGAMSHENVSFETLAADQPKTVISSQLTAASCSVSLRIALDNNLAEYTIGGTVLQWETASFSKLPRSWGLTVVEPPVDPKAKKPPAKGAAPEPEDPRAKFLENVESTLKTSPTEYHLSISSADYELSAMKLTKGVVSFDREAAEALPAEEDASERGDLWSVQYGPSALVFLSRAHVRRMLRQADTIEFTVQLTKDTPAEPPAETEHLEASGELDMHPITAPDERQFTLITSLDIDGVASSLEVSLSLSQPLRQSAGVSPTDMKPVDVISLHEVGGGAMNRDVKKELRTEISEIVKELALEYVSIYPQPPAASGSAANQLAGVQVATDERKMQFMHHLSISGIYHHLKEKLKPRIQRVVRERYGPRNRALGKSGMIPPEGIPDGTDPPMEEMIAELYVLLVNECNSVLNAMYKNTMVDRDQKEIEQAPAIDDEVETPRQMFKRLFRLAGDAEADGRYTQAEQFHLERIHLLELQPTLNAELSYPHQAYFQYNEYLLRRCATLYIHSMFDSDAALSAEASFDKAREALSLAISVKKDEWLAHLQQGAMLLEAKQYERAQESVLESIALQLRPQNKGGFQVVDELQGYESDSLCPVHPLCYIVLCLYFTKLNLPLAARKAVRMAVRSFEEGEYQPPVKEHGKPCRTAALCFAQAAVYLYERGLRDLGAMSLRFAQECDEAATAKALERNLPTDTPHLIRHVMKRAAALRALFAASPSEAYGLAMDSVSVAKAPMDIVNGWLTVAKCSNYIDNLGASEVITAYSQAIAEVRSWNEASQDMKSIPLSGFIEVGKLLIANNRYTEALDAMMLGCSVYSSSSLFLLVGICCLRLDRLVDAEDALQEANLLDNRNPEVWAFLSILCLSTGGAHRMHEAEKSLEQALRLGLTNASILRELATAYIAVDKLQLAEDLTRRALASEWSLSQDSKSSPYTRRLLGDILAGQNQAVQAIEEYQQVLADDAADMDTRLDAAEKCRALLVSLGRTEEIKTLNGIVNSLSVVQQ